MTPTDWNALAERCRDAKGADREVDGALDIAVGGPQEFFGAYYGSPAVDYGMFASDPAKWSGMGRSYAAPRYTASLDAITALVERELAGRMWAVWRTENAGKAAIDPTTPQAIYADGAAPALALCAAFCFAMAAREGSAPA